MEPILSLQNIELDRGKTFSLKIDHLKVMSGGLYALTGPNGAGKSTLLGVLAMLIRPKSGDLSVLGAPVLRKASQLKELRRQITLVEQSPYLFNDTVYQNLALGLRLRGTQAKEQDALIKEALEAVGLHGFEQRQAQDLSGGETRRVALARALALKPKVLLLDEPMANIDEASLAVFESLLTSLPQQGMTIIFSTHDSDQPERLSAEVIHMNNGRLEKARSSQTSRQNDKATEKVAWPGPIKLTESSYLWL
ncbi:MAG: energy-coupling factor ABC transporter ATP-binding protein [Desulfuromonadales bacterium]|nr:energy-coupling factor ABC transporter ATP-binding protein [Desulfuromonadales bacterium]